MVKKVSVKQVLVNTFGGCQICGYNKCLAALAFHHLDPAKKEFQISSFRKNAVDDYKLLQELEKCIIVCHNCHAEIEYGGMHKEKLAEIDPLCIDDII